MKGTWKKTIEVPGNWQNEELVSTLGLKGQGQGQCCQSPPVLEPGARGQKLSRDSLEVPREGKKPSPPFPSPTVCTLWKSMGKGAWIMYPVCISLSGHREG